MGIDPLTLTMGAGLLGAASGAASLVGQGNSIAAQGKQQTSRDDLALAEQRRAQQTALAKTLARQNVGFAARGADPTSGSALGLARAAESQAARNLSLIDADQALREQGRTGGGLSLASSLLNLGQSGLGMVSQVNDLWKQWR